LSDAARISRSQLRCFEKERGKLRPEQIEKVEQAQLERMREQQARLSKLVSGEAA
jgi:hypothetical protein